MPETMPETMPDTYVIIVGGGVTGIAAAYNLKKHGIPYILLEDASDIGGTWLTHRFHGCRVDTPVSVYCFSFKLVLDKEKLWTSRQVYDYLREIVTENNLLEHFRFNRRVETANFVSEENRWHVKVAGGRTFTSKFVINANGFGNYSHPHIPTFEGMDTFNGEVVHSTRLQDSREFHDKNVVIVGSGATAFSMITELQKVCKSLTLVQRSPSYVYEMGEDKGWRWETTNWIQKNISNSVAPAFQATETAIDDVVYTAIRKFPSLAKRYFRSQWTDVCSSSFIEEHLTPVYNPFEQRVAVTTGLREAIKENRIKIVTGRILRFTPAGLAMSTGNEVPCEVCVLATGFDVTPFQFDVSIDGKRVDTRRINFYKSFMMGGIPNYFQPFGCFDCAWTTRVESICKFVCELILHMKTEKTKTVSVRRNVNLARVTSFTANYITRDPDLPVIGQDLFDIPTLDALFSFRKWTCGELQFA